MAGAGDTSETFSIGALASSANSGRRVERRCTGSTRYRAVDTIIRAAPALSSRCRVSVSRQAALRSRRPGERIDHYRSMPCVYAACCIHDIVCHLMSSGPAGCAPLARYPYWFHHHWRSPMSRSWKVRSSFFIRISARRSAITSFHRRFDSRSWLLAMLHAIAKTPLSRMLMLICQ